MEKTIFYRDFEIYPSTVSYWKATDWSWVHKDYDGEGDNRHGYGESIDDCKKQIDEWYEEQE